MPLVSVVVPTYNRPDLMRRAVNTVLAQTLQDIEVLLIADSIDKATLIAAHSIEDIRVRCIELPERKGAGEKRDIGARASLAPWIAFLDDDDEWLPKKLELQLAAAGDDQHAIIISQYRVIGSFGERIMPIPPYSGHEPLDEWLFDRKVWFGGGQRMLQTSALMIPRVLFATLRFGTVRHEEWELVLRAVKQQGYRLLTVPEPLVIYYTGNTYPWQSSVLWAQSVRDLLSKRALSGFCLTIATHGISGPNRQRAFRNLLRTAFEIGQPTAKQLFAFAVIWALPEALRHRLRVTFTKNSAR